MCGIAGVIRWSADQSDCEAVGRMVRAQRHRGPDGSLVLQCQRAAAGRPAVTLGHTRLAILDLSDAARQPMKGYDSDVWIVYNGETFNFRALRSELERDGRPFRSNSDTEVVLRAYEHWGDDFVHRLRGMGACAIWDGRLQRLVLVRDRLGIKPLYYYAGSGFLAWASEVRALLASELVPRRLDPLALDQYLAYQTVPCPRTLVEGVRMLPPGHVLTVEPAGRVSIERYWDQLASASDQAGHVGVVECRQRLGELLRESAALHLVSDVPVGVFLSGGIDSSALVSLLRDAGETPRTFSVTFREEAHDESRHARAVAAHFGTDHAEIRLEGDALADAVPEIMARVDHPSGDGINTAVIAQAVRGAGIKVALSGLGGDEIFGGYQSFVRLRRWSAWSPLWARVPGHLRELAASTVDGLGRSAAATKAAAVLRTDGRLAGAYPPLRQVFSPAERAQLLASAVWQRTAGVPDPYVAFLEEAFRGADRIDVTTLVSYAEARTYMHDVLLRDTDQMSMASGLEVRVPLLDHQVVQYVTGLPGALKCGGATPKALLTESLSSPLPDTVVRRPKQGFVLPLDTWMRGPLRDFCADHLAPERLGSRGAFSAAGRASVWQRFLGGDPRVTWSRVWALIALDVWLERSGVEFHGQ